MSLQLRGRLKCLRSGCERTVDVMVRLEIGSQWDPEGGNSGVELRQIVVNLPGAWKPASQYASDSAYCPEHSRFAW